MKTQQTLPIALLATLIVSACLINTNDSQTNNLKIAGLQLIFSCTCLWAIRKNPLLCRAAIFLLLPTLSMLASTLLSPLKHDGSTAAWARVIGYASHFIFALSVAVLASEKNLNENSLLKASAAASFIYSGFVAAYWVLSEAPLDYPWVTSPPLFNNIRHTGFFLTPCALIAAHAALAGYPKIRVLAGFTFTIAMAIIFWSGSRGAFIATFAGLVALALMPPLNANRSRWADLALGNVAALAISAYYQVNNSSMGWLAAGARSMQAQSLESMTSLRTAIWAELLPLIAERPWLGWGGESFRRLMPHWGFISQAHNGPLQLLLEWGLIGMLLIAGPIAWLSFKGALRALRKQPTYSHRSLGLAIVISLLAYSLVDGIFYHGTPMLFLMLGVGLLLADETAHCTLKARPTKKQPGGAPP